MKLLLILSVLSLSTYALEFEYSVKKDNEGFACTKARGESRRKLIAKCEKDDKKFVNWKKIKISECKSKQLDNGKYKATYKYKYECIIKKN